MTATVQHTYAAEGTYTVTLTVVDDEGAVSAPATTMAAIEPVICNFVVAPISLDFSQVNVGEPATLHTTITNNGTADCTITASVVSATSEFTLTSESPITVPAKDGTANEGTAIVSVDYMLVDTGDDSGTLNLDSADPNNLQNESVQLTGEGIQAPVILIEEEQREIVATGYFTEVTSDATAVDKDSFVTSLEADDPDPYRPERHTITYTAKDNDNNSSTDTQTLNILPLVTLAGTQATGEGQTVSVPIIMNGVSPDPDNPVTIDYSVDGTAVVPDDHDLVDGSVTIASGETSAQLEINIHEDSTEADEQIVITLTKVSGKANLSSDVLHTIVITEHNLAPIMSINIDQAGASGPYIYSALGTVTLTANATDPNGDSLTFDWSASDRRLTDIVADDQSCTDNQLCFEPPADPGSYQVSVLINDGVSQVAHTATLVVVGETTELSATQRSDDDKDGLPNYLDDVDDVTLLQTSVADGDDFKRMIRSDAGVALALGSLALEAQRNGARISMADVIDASGNSVTDTAFTSIGFVYDFEIRGLSAAQRTTRVVMPLETNTPLNAEYRKLSQGAWHTFVEDATDRLRSASNIGGTCSFFGASDYQDGLIAFTDCIELTLTDGGPNDADGEANGVIKDPGGVAVPANAPAPTSSDLNSSPGGAGALGWWWLMMLAPLLLLQHRFR